jgi:hypothetical protein
MGSDFVLFHLNAADNLHPEILRSGELDQMA